MKRMLKKWISGTILASMLISSPVNMQGNLMKVEAAEGHNPYVWENNDRNLVYSADETVAEANSTQSGYGAEKLLDDNLDTRWESSWNNTPDSVEITMKTKDGNPEYFTGVKYVSRQDNNIGGVMTDYRVYSSEDGVTYGETPVIQGEIAEKLGTWYLTFEEPVKAASIKIVSNIKAAAEMRLLYVPTDEEDYIQMKAEAEALREEAEGNKGEDIGQWRPSSLETFDQGMQIINLQDVPETQEERAAIDDQILLLISDLKRALLTSTTELNQELRQAEVLLNAANVGDTPLTYSQESIDEFQAIIAQATETAGNMAASTGAVQDARQMLEDGVFAFKTAQNKPEITYTGRASAPLSYMMDLLLESHFQGSGTGDQVYVELDYGTTELVFETLTFQTWWATGQNINRIKVDYKDGTGKWIPIDGGKEYSMQWTTNTNVSETQSVAFETSVKGTAIRIYIMGASASYVIDELTVGTAVGEEDVQIMLDHDTMTLAEGENGKLTATVLPEYIANKNVIFTSSNESILNVSKDGAMKVKGLPEGEEQAEVIITATTEYGGKTAQCIVTVIPKITEDEDKQDTRVRLKNAKKLADAAKQEDYKAGAVDQFQAQLASIESKLSSNITGGQLVNIETELKNVRKQFEEASLIPINETRNLIDRITGNGSSEKFIVETITADEATGNDVYEVGWNEIEKKPILKGNNGVSLATAYNYYLKYYAFLDYPYVGDSSLKLPEAMPVVNEPVRIVFPYEYRHYFNENCEYKYTADLYGEKEWQHRIDWMAMNGFNMFLMDLGEHAIWYRAKDELGLNDAAIGELQRYSNGTEQYEGKYEISPDAINQEGMLAKKVVEMAFKAGMEPEVRPFIGQVPFMFPDQREEYYGSRAVSKMTISLEGSIFDQMYLYPAAKWINLPQGVFISPEVASSDAAKAEEMKEKFVKISDIYYDSLQEVLGFNEWGRTPEYAYKDLVGEQGFVVQNEAFPQKVLREINDQLMNLNPDAIWLQTSWRYQSWLPQYYDEGRLMFIDLCAENRPKWNSSNEFGENPWLWSMLFNFGGNTGIEGDLKGLPSDVLTAKDSSNYMKGVSISPEGGDTNPALYAIMSEMTWRSEIPDMDQWISDYIKRRYGSENYEKAKEELEQVWDTLCGTVYKGFVSYDGPTQTLVNAYPKLSGAISRTYGSNAKMYQTQELLPAWKAMLKAAEKMDKLTPQFKYDMVDITRQALADISGEVYGNIKPAFDSGDKEAAMEYVNQMIQICKDLDKILATDKEFMLGTRLERAKNRGVTQSDKEFYEKLERTFSTYWVLDDPTQTSLTDYCNRHLSGLMSDYYGMRWEVFAKYLEQAMDKNMNAAAFNAEIAPKIKAEIQEKEVAWSTDRTPYPTEETGDVKEISQELLNKYSLLIDELYGASDDSLDLTLEGMSASAGNVQSETGTEGPASNVLDNNPGTIWHTAWAGSDRNVQWIDIALGEKQIVGGLRYLPRQGGGVNGIITSYEIYISNDNGQTYSKVSEGEWSKNTIWKIASFDSVEATNVKLQVKEALTDSVNKQFASAAEIRILKGDSKTEPSKPDKSGLGALIDHADSIPAKGWEEASYGNMQEYLKKAKEVFQNESATEDDIRKAEKELQMAIDGLKKLPVTVKLDKTSATLKLYSVNSVNLKAVVSGSSQTIAWSSSNSKVAIVDQKGTVTAKSAGTVKITATVEGVSASCEVTVIVPGIRMDKTSAVIYTKGTSSITLKAITSNIQGKISWRTSDASIAKVSEGKVTARKAGTVMITATADGVSASCKVIVKEPNIKLSKSKAILYIKGRTTLVLKPTVTGSSKKVSWKTSSKKIVTVKNGKVTAKKIGTATITATANGKSVKCKITVKKPGLKLEKSTFNLKKGKKAFIKATAKPAGKIRYKSDKSKIASVSSKGIIKANKKGNCKISVTCNGVKKVISVVVR